MNENRTPTIRAKLYRATIEQKDYAKLENKPQINNIELIGNKTLEELGIQEEMTEFSNEDILRIWNEY